MSILQTRGSDQGEVTEWGRRRTQTGEKPELTTAHTTVTEVGRGEQRGAEPVGWLGVCFLQVQEF